MKPVGVFSSLSGLFDPAEVRRARQLKKQWDELDDIAAIIQDNNKTPTMQEKEPDEGNSLRDEMNMLLERVAADTKRIGEIISELLPD